MCKNAIFKGKLKLIFKKNNRVQFDLTNSSRPVMVFIHGGAWSMGSGNGMTDIHGPSYFLDRDIVLVTINYRLGPLGRLESFSR